MNTCVLTWLMPFIVCVCDLFSFPFFAPSPVPQSFSARVTSFGPEMCARQECVYANMLISVEKICCDRGKKTHSSWATLCAIGFRSTGKKWMSAYAFVAQKTINVTSPYLGITIVDIWFIFKTVNGKIWTRARSLVLCRLVACGRRRPFYTTCELWIFLNSNTRKLIATEHDSVSFIIINQEITAIERTKFN